MLRRLVRGYYSLRYLPRRVFAMLSALAVQNAALKQGQDNGFRRNAVALADVQSEIGGFCDDATRAMLGLDRSVAAVSGRMSALHLDLVRVEGAGVATNQALNEVNDAIQAMRAELAAIAATTRRQTRRLTGLERAVAREGASFPSWIWTPELGERLRSIMGLLTPIGVVGVAKRRLGRDRDGGYVMLDDFDGIAAAVSVGIADDVSWDLDIVEHGIPVLQFDPSIPAPPIANPLFRFEPLAVMPQNGDGEITLDTIVNERLAGVDGPLLLKLDIEGFEWSVISATSIPTLRRFKQIVCEFHTLEQLGESQFSITAGALFAKLNMTHAVVHVHGNNCANFVNIGNVVVPQSLEVSFALRDAYELTASDEVFPTPLDRPNEPDRADLYLGQFRFENAAVA